MSTSPSTQWSDVVPHLTGLAHLATSDPDGRPAVGLVSPLIADGVVWAQTRRSSRKATNVAANPEVALMWEADGEIYVWGVAELIDDVDTKREWWPTWHYDAASFFGDPADPGVVLLRITPARATLLVAGEAGPVRRVWSA